MRFNNDSGNNYAIRNSGNGAADSSSASQSGLVLTGTVATQQFTVIELDNIAANEKHGIYNSNESSAAGAGNAPNRRVGIFKWANTSDQISRVDVFNTGTGDYATGSEVIVLGHN